MTNDPARKPEFEESMWIPPSTLPWYLRWTRGWRLALVLMLVGASFYLPWRGLEDYRSLKSWRARSLAREAMDYKEVEAKAVKLFEQAGTLAPNDSEVLRTLADFTEEREDLMALYAMRKLVSNGKPTPEDRERLCRLAFDWGHPEMADTATLSQWAQADPATLALRPLDLSARWLANRGQRVEAEKRLRAAVEKTPAGPNQASLQFYLAKLLLASNAAQSGEEATLTNCLQLLTSAIKATAPPLPMRAAAASLMAETLTASTWHQPISPDMISFIRKTLNEETAATRPTNPFAALKSQTSRIEFDLALNPSLKQSLAKELLDATAGADAKQRLIVVQWLIQHSLPRMALATCDAHPQGDADRDWFTARLDAIFQLKDWGLFTKLLESPTQPLPLLLKTFYFFRLELARNAEPAEVEKARSAVLQAAGQAEPKDTLSVAGTLESLQELNPALTLYTSVQNHAQAGLPARLGIIRCLNPQLERSGELVQALEALVRLWPHGEEARSDLVYLRLLDKTTVPDDLTFVKDLQARMPEILAYRISAAIALFREKKPAEALALLQKETLPWPRIQAGWRAVYAAILAANDQLAEARQLTTTLTKAELRPGERRLLTDYSIEPP